MASALNPKPFGNGIWYRAPMRRLCQVNFSLRTLVLPGAVLAACESKSFVFFSPVLIASEEVEKPEPPIRTDPAKNAYADIAVRVKDLALHTRPRNREAAIMVIKEKVLID